MKRHNVVNCFELLSTKNNAVTKIMYNAYLSNISIRFFVLLAYPLLFLNLFTLLSIYIVNSLVKLLLFCYFSLHQCIWLYENKEIQALKISNGVKLVLWVQTSLINEMMRSRKCSPHCQSCHLYVLFTDLMHILCLILANE